MVKLHHSFALQNRPGTYSNHKRHSRQYLLHRVVINANLLHVALVREARPTPYFLYSKIHVLGRNRREVDANAKPDAIERSYGTRTGSSST